MNKYIFALILGLFLIPTTSFASNLSSWQIDSILGLLKAFNVDSSILLNVQYALIGTVSTSTGNVTAPSVENTSIVTTTPTVVYMPVYIGSAPIVTVPEPVKPTCMINVSSTTDSIGNIIGKVNWTSTDSNSGYLQSDYPQGIFKTVSNLNPIESGELKGWRLSSFMSTSFKVVFSGNGGSTSCTGTIPFLTSNE